MLKLLPPIEYQQLFLWYIGDHTLRTSVKYFRQCKKVLMNAGKPMNEKRGFERI